MTDKPKAGCPAQPARPGPQADKQLQHGDGQGDPAAILEQVAGSLGQE